MHGEKRSELYIYVDHTINSACGQERQGCKVGGRVLNLYGVIYIYYIKLTSFFPVLVLAIPTFIPFFRNVFSLVHVAFFC